MKKTLCALAVGATILTPVMAAAADVQVYGRAHVSLDYLDDGKDYNEANLSSNSSRLGFKVNQKVNDDLNVFAQIEQEINFASGSNDDKNGIKFATRDTFVGVKSNSYGQVRVGRFDSPFKVARSPINFFGDQLGDMRNVTRADNMRFDERNANTIEYKSPKFGGGFNVIAAMSLHDGVYDEKQDKDTIGDGTGDGTGKNKNKTYDLAVTYKNGPIDIATAYEKYQSKVKYGERDAFRVAAAYNITSDLKLGGLYQISKHDNDVANPDVQVYGVAGEYKLSPKTALRGQYLLRDVDTSNENASLIAVGVEHKLNSAVRVYANLATVLNDDKSELTPWQQGRSTDITGVEGEDSTGLSLGFRYDF
ncbi:porin [Acinetobacter sp. ANC 7201]|uniref:porin n=1 Tax=Acinetobacter sp. ANC 7201 TaxID=3035288 RepID=UPI0027A5D0F6|nr:porin [Acinetobacter sp. ANC 7201]WFP97848.1 porin [Acinetobacter sp. ANC 7201]